MANPRYAVVDEVLRYTKAADPRPTEVDGYRNFHHLSSAPDSDDNALQLDRGINSPALLRGAKSRARAVVALRTSPGKAGQESTPWHDTVDTAAGTATYYGDNKPGPRGETQMPPGNAILLEVSAAHTSQTLEARLQAPPILLFTSETVIDRRGRRAEKGYVSYQGLYTVSDLDEVVQYDSNGVEFKNLRCTLTRLRSASGAETLDWRWIDDRRDPDISYIESLMHAPREWLRWLDTGN